MIKQCLLIEDDRIAQKIPVLIMKSQGWQVCVVDTPTAALKAIVQQHYDLILTDIGLPEMSGHELSVKLRELTQNVNLPIIGLTAHGNLALEPKSEINKMFSKPFTQEILLYIHGTYFETQKNLQKVS